MLEPYQLNKEDLQALRHADTVIIQYQKGINECSVIRAQKNVKVTNPYNKDDFDTQWFEHRINLTHHVINIPNKDSIDDYSAYKSYTEYADACWSGIAAFLRVNDYIYVEWRENSTREQEALGLCTYQCLIHVMRNRKAYAFLFASLARKISSRTISI